MKCATRIHVPHRTWIPFNFNTFDQKPAKLSFPSANRWSPRTAEWDKVHKFRLRAVPFCLGGVCVCLKCWMCHEQILIFKLCFYYVLTAVLSIHLPGCPSLMLSAGVAVGCFCCIRFRGNKEKEWEKENFTGKEGKKRKRSSLLYLFFYGNSP